MSIECIKDANLEETGFSYTMSLIQGKYKMFILYALMGFQVVRFNELKKYIKTISYKTLSTTLKELEADGLVHREEYPQIPPKVEYSLTDRGKSLIPLDCYLILWYFFYLVFNCAGFSVYGFPVNGLSVCGLSVYGFPLRGYCPYGSARK